MRTPLFKITGCAQVGLSATEYLRSGSNPFALFLATISSASLVRKKSTEPASTIAALSAFGSPQSGAVARIEAEELPAFEVGEAEQEVAAHHRRVHVHPDVLVLPDRFGDPFRAAFQHLDAHHAVVEAREDQSLPIQNRCHNILLVGGAEGNAPQEFARRR